MNSGDYPYIWRARDWPAWRFDLAALAGPLVEVSRAQGLLMGRLADVGRHVEGVVDRVLDATAHCHAVVSPERLFGWHAALFPTGYSGLSRIKCPLL
jgi:Domain of unknown function (DUF4172)